VNLPVLKIECSEDVWLLGLSILQQTWTQFLPCGARNSPYLLVKHGDWKQNVSKPRISIIKCIPMRKKMLFGEENLVSGDLFIGVSHQKATWEKISLGALLLRMKKSRHWALYCQYKVVTELQSSSISLGHPYIFALNCQDNTPFTMLNFPSKSTVHVVYSFRLMLRPKW